MPDKFLDHLKGVLAGIEADGLYKRERLIAGPQGGRIESPRTAAGAQMVNLCANNYLGLADHPEVIAAAQGGARSVRLRHGLGALHLRRADPASRAGAARSRAISARTTRSCSPPVSTPMAACSSRCSATRTPSSPTRSTTPRSSTACGSARPSATASPTATWTSWRTACKEADAAGARFKLIATDGVFSMDGHVAKLPDDLRPRRAIRRAGAWSTIATPPAISASRGKGTPALTGAGARVDIVTGTFGKTLGGAHGRLRRGGAADRRSAAPARAALSVLQQPRPAGRRRLAQGARDRRSAPTIGARCWLRHARRFRDGARRGGLRAARRARRRSFR